jgi:hypothetical protein
VKSPIPVIAACLVAVLVFHAAGASAGAASSVPSGTLRQLDTRHYSIHTDLERSLAEDLARRLDAMYEEYARRLADFGTPVEQEQTLQVYLFRKHDDYQTFVQNRAPNTGGVFLPARQMLVAYYEGQGRDALRRTLQHEAFHQFAHARISPDLPPWLNEGLASLFEEGIWTGKGFELGEVPPRRVRQLRADLTGKRLTDFRQFMAMDLDRWNGALGNEPGLGAAQYNQAWAMVHFLVFSTERGQFKYRKRFVEMLRLIHDGKTTQDAFEQSLSRNVEGFQSRFLEYIPTLMPTQRATLIERQEILGDMLIELSRMGKRFDRVDDFRKDLIENGYRLRYSKGEVRWASESDPQVYFCAPDGRLLTSDELFFESRSQSPLPDLVYRGPGALKLRMRFYDMTDAVHREVIVEGAS